MKKTIKEALIIVFASIVLGFIANAVSPKGVPLFADYSERFAIDSVKSVNSIDLNKRGKLNKGGFYEPVNIPLEAAKQLFDDKAVFIDAREDNEFKEGHIKGARNIPYKAFLESTNEQKMEMMKGIEKERIIVSYCSSDSCEISIDNAYEMAKIGYNDVKIFVGGIKEWKNKDYPVEK